MSPEDYLDAARATQSGRRRADLAGGAVRAIDMARVIRALAAAAGSRHSQKQTMGSASSSRSISRTPIKHSMSLHTEHEVPHAVPSHGPSFGQATSPVTHSPEEFAVPGWDARAGAGARRAARLARALPQRLRYGPVPELADDEPPPPPAPLEA